MLEPGNDDLVVPADVPPAPALRDEIDRLGGAADEDDLVGRRCVQEAADLFPGRLVGVGRAGGEFVGAPMDVGVLMQVEVRHTVDDGLWLLGGGGVVEPDQRPGHGLATGGSGNPAGGRSRRMAGARSRYPVRARSSEIPEPVRCAEAPAPHRGSRTTNQAWRVPRDAAPSAERRRGTAEPEARFRPAMGSPSPASWATKTGPSRGVRTSGHQAAGP
jgi:hypothetical protein